MSALHELTANVEQLCHRMPARLSDAVLIRNNIFATHLFRVVQEAINNALKHGKARQVVGSRNPPPGKPN